MQLRLALFVDLATQPHEKLLAPCARWVRALLGKPVEHRPVEISAVPVGHQTLGGPRLSRPGIRNQWAARAEERNASRLIV